MLTALALLGSRQLSEPHDILPPLVGQPAVGTLPRVALQGQVALDEVVQELMVDWIRLYKLDGVTRTRSDAF